MQSNFKHFYAFNFVATVYFLFQHDCAPLKTWCDEFAVEELWCPAQSPDLNYTEQLWDVSCETGLLVQDLCMTNSLLNEKAQVPIEIFQDLAESLLLLQGC